MLKDAFCRALSRFSSEDAKKSSTDLVIYVNNLYYFFKKLQIHLKWIFILNNNILILTIKYKNIYKKVFDFLIGRVGSES